ncbi:hypothetical protein GCM10020295_16520 [Streptomyces cinereospinus]
MAAARRIVIENCAIATVDADDTEYASGYVVVAGHRIEALGSGRAPEGLENVVRRIDASGHLVTPGLVNTHHHFYQWITRGMATDHNLFDWLVALYPVWARIDEQMTYAAAQGSLAMMARGGVTTAMDHHYVFPHGSGDLSGSVIRAARETGVRFTLARGSMDRSEKDGGLPPDFAVESLDGALAATEETVRQHHDASFDAMTQVAVAPPAPRSPSPPTCCARAPSWPAGSASGCTRTVRRPWRRRSSATSCSAWAPPTTSSPPAGWARTCGWRTAST